MKEFFVAAAAVAALALPYASAQTACTGSTLGGTVRDTTQALVPGATVVLDGRRNWDSSTILRQQALGAAAEAVINLTP